MARLAREPKVVSLAKDLGLNWRGDCVASIREHAIAQIEAIRRHSALPIGNLDMLRKMVADKFRVRLEFIRDDSDVERIAAEYQDFHPLLRHRLAVEFIQRETEGITLAREEWDPRVFRYLAVVDARGERSARAYFTAWHELTHLLVQPPQIPIPGFRRTPPALEREKDPIESVVDHIAGKVAFYPPFFRPALEQVMSAQGALDFTALENARDAAAPAASLLATAMGSIQLVDEPMLLVTAGMALKAAERRLSRGLQQAFEFATAAVQEKLRVTTVVPNDLAAESGLAIRRNMRIPADSALSEAHESSVDVTLVADEDQAWWETSQGGPLACLPIHVEAARRGRYVYGLISLLG